MSGGRLSTVKGPAKRKVVTSGRLTGGVKVRPAREQVTPSSAPAACSEPAYTLYSTDSEDQVATLNKGLDRCAALLSGILQAEKAASPSVPRALKGGVARSRQSTAAGKKTVKKPPTKTAGRGGPGIATPRTTHRSAASAAHSGVKLHPPRRHTQLRSPIPPSCSPTPPPTSPVAQPQTSVLLSVVQSSSCSGQLSLHSAASRLSEVDAGHEDEFVPVRCTDTDAHTNQLTRSCTVKMSNMQLAPGQETAETDLKSRTVQHLLEELKTLMAGQGSVAEILLSHLEKTVSSPQMNAGSCLVQTVPDMSSLHSQNTQLHRNLKRQLKEKEDAERVSTEAFSNTEGLTLQEELTSAQSRLQELQDDLAELRGALREAQGRLMEKEAENVAVNTELETTRSRLSDCEREKSALATLAQQRLEEIETLHRVRQSHDSSHSSTAAPATDHIAQYLMSLEQLVPAERRGNALSQSDVRCQGADNPEHALDSPLGQSPRLDEVQSHGPWLDRERGRPSLWTLSRCDVESEWSVTTGSTFDTRDEAAFRDGLAALDASIASLQKTIQLDLRR